MLVDMNETLTPIRASVSMYAWMMETSALGHWCRLIDSTWSKVAEVRDPLEANSFNLDSCSFYGRQNVSELAAVCSTFVYRPTISLHQRRIALYFHTHPHIENTFQGFIRRKWTAGHVRWKAALCCQWNGQWFKAHDRTQLIFIMDGGEKCWATKCHSCDMAIRISLTWYFLCCL